MSNPYQPVVDAIHAMGDDISAAVDAINIPANTLNTDEYNAIHGATSPSASNVFVTNADIDAAETVSRTIYVTATGNDTTGDGSVGNPFLTIGKAVSTVKRIINGGVVVTIDIGNGTFNLSASDIGLIGSISGAGDLVFIGKYTLADSGFTMGSALALDPLTYNVSGGNTAGWTLNQWKFYFLKSGSAYYPITHNALTPTLSVANNVIGTEIYNLSTIINWPSGNVQFEVANLMFKVCRINFPGSTIRFSAGNAIITFDNCYLTGVGTSTFINFFVGCRWTIVRSCCNLVSFIINENSTLQPFYNYFYHNTTSSIMQFSKNPVAIQTWAWEVFENIGGTTAVCIYYTNSGTVSSVTSTHYFKFVNSNVCIRHGSNANINFAFNSARVILVNCNYLVERFSTTSDYVPVVFDIPFVNLIGVPVIRYFSNPMYEFVNYINSRLIKITGLLYPEIENNLSATLADNTTTNFIVGNKLQNQSIRIEYTIKRLNGYRKGSFDIINDGTALYMSPDTFITNGDAGVSAAAIVLTANYNTNEIRVAALLSSTGQAATFKYNASRVMITPLTI